MRKLWFDLLLIWLLTGCRGEAKDLPDVAVDLRVTPDSPYVGPATMIVTLKDAQKHPIDKAQVELEGNMRHAGMVPAFAQAVEVAPGRYEAELEFTMGGDWFILVRANLPGGRTLERKIDVPGMEAVCGTP